MMDKLKYKIKMLLRKFFKNPQNKELLEPKKYWDSRFDEYAYHHSRQNIYLSNDFLNEIKNKKIFFETFTHASTLIEVGCGTGEFSQIIVEQYQNIKVLTATDISEEGINHCNKINKYKNRINYLVHNSLEDNEGFMKLGKYNLAVCSNVLEHFQNPYPLIDQMLAVAKKICILVPYNHLSDILTYAGEGGGACFLFYRKKF